jgi:hypothetical protein
MGWSVGNWARLSSLGNGPPGNVFGRGDVAQLVMIRAANAENVRIIAVIAIAQVFKDGVIFDILKPPKVLFAN